MKWSEYKIKRVNKGDKDYPRVLNELKDSPKQIYYRGELNGLFSKKSIAIVGSRRMTRYGASIIDKFVSAFAVCGVTTVSGYMYGVDTEVHSKTVEYGGQTIVVMGGGINTPYPSENDKLYTKILQSGGVVLSEYKPEAKPKLWMYPQRNRIIAALGSMGTLVIEAGERSGSLITVDYARQLGRRIFAVPGPISSSVSVGTNMIIKKGIAELVTGPEDIVKNFQFSNSNFQNDNKDLEGIEREIFGILKNEEMSIDEVAVAIDKDLVEVSTVVSMMALKGIISEAGGKYFVV